MTTNPEVLLKRKRLVGRRVRFVFSDDEHTKLVPGTLGTVTLVDDGGTIHVDWDDGSRLGLVEQAGDRYEVLP